MPMQFISLTNSLNANLSLRAEQYSPFLHSLWVNKLKVNKILSILFLQPFYELQALQMSYLNDVPESE
jgi:hypothetical protein